MASNFYTESPWFDRSWTQEAPSNYQCWVRIWELLGFFNFLIEGKLLYSVVLVAAVLQCESALCIYVHLSSFLDSQEFKPVNPKGINLEYSLQGLMLKLKLHLATWCEEPTHWKWLWCWERLRARGKGGDRGWDDWIASLTQWAWI